MISNAKFLLPKKNIDYSKFSVIACDQFTSQMDYWNKLKDFVGDSKSALSLTFPEIYLSSDNSKYIQMINDNMKKYLNENIFDEYEGLILVERELKNKKIRLGLMLAIDLEAYEYTEKNNAAIKATEKTVVERLPVRIEIRKDADLELPHIMLLMDDKNEQILEDLYKRRDEFEKIYDFELNMDGGHIRGYYIKNTQEILESILTLKAENGMLFAVGDGNHSLATAKECYKINKDNPLARYAICELVSIYDKSLDFEPIHRVITGADEEFIEEMQKSVKGDYKTKIIYKAKEYELNVSTAADAIKDIQDFIDEYMKKHKGLGIDYIHGDNYLREVASSLNAVGIYMPKIEKNELFDYVVRRGVLPRKAFSMGIAEDKRYYLEARKIK